MRGPSPLRTSASPPLAEERRDRHRGAAICRNAHRAVRVAAYLGPCETPEIILRSRSSSVGFLRLARLRASQQTRSRRLVTPEMNVHDEFSNDVERAHLSR